MGRFIEDEGEFGLRILGMNEESSAAINIGPQHAQTLVGSVPGFDDNVVQFIAQEVFHDPLVARLDFKEIREHAYWSQAALHYSGLEKPADGFGRISVLRDHCFQRPLLA